MLFQVKFVITGSQRRQNWADERSPLSGQIWAWSGPVRIVWSEANLNDVA